MQAVGDGGQGWGNAVLYIFLSPVIRSRLFIEPLEDCYDAVKEKFQGLHVRDVYHKTSLNSAERRKTDSSQLAMATEARGYKIQEYNDAVMTSVSGTGGTSPAILTRSDKYGSFHPPLTKNPNLINSQ